MFSTQGFNINSDGVTHQVVDKLIHFTQRHLPQLHSTVSLLDDANYHQTFPLPFSTADVQELLELETICLRLVAGIWWITSPSAILVSQSLHAPTNTNQVSVIVVI